MFTDDEKQKIIKDMCDIIKCRTVSYVDESKIDKEQFKNLRLLLKQRFPLIYKHCQYFEVGKTGLIHKIKGKDGNENHGCVLMAHYDVVPANEEEWDFPPFAGDVVDGFVRGRGTLDTKGTFCSCMEAVELKLKEGWLPNENLFLCFSGEEEISGNSCPDMVEWFSKQKIEVDFVLDEGGAVVDNVFPGVEKQCAMIGTAEKGFANVDIVVEGNAGHASAPPRQTAVGLAGKIAAEIEKHSCKAEYTSPVKEMLKNMSRNNTKGILKFVFGCLAITKPLVNAISKKLGGELNAMLHTTCALTMLEGSKAYNVLPSMAKIGMNLRLLGSDTVDKATARLKKYAEKAVGKDAKVTVMVKAYSNPSRESDTKCDAYQKLYDAVHATWPDVIISPYLMMAGSDSRHYCKITDKVYRFSGMFMTKEERGMIHGKNERISCETLIKTVEFYTNVIENL